jgi:hypothetical protein
MEIRERDQQCYYFEQVPCLGSEHWNFGPLTRKLSSENDAPLQPQG